MPTISDLTFDVSFDTSQFPAASALSNLAVLMRVQTYAAILTASVAPPVPVFLSPAQVDRLE
jgi:hypothetical protein